MQNTKLFNHFIQSIKSYYRISHSQETNVFNLLFDLHIKNIEKIDFDFNLELFENLISYHDFETIIKILDLHKKIREQPLNYCSLIN